MKTILLSLFLMVSANCFADGVVLAIDPTGTPGNQGTNTTGTVYATNNFTVQGNLKASTLTIGASTNVPSFTLVNTNWIDGGTYTNQTGRTIEVKTPCTVTPGTGIGGNATYAIKVAGTATNVLSVGTLATSLAMPQTNQISVFVTNSGVFIFTNLSTGTGSTAAILNGGQYMVY